MNMPKGTSITFFERERIESFLRMKKKKTWIAEKLGRDYSVIKREIRRNSSPHLPYVAIRAGSVCGKTKEKYQQRKLEKWQNEKLKSLSKANS
ncbi:MAG: helix-turn-helix domain-containing protein [Candidatus Moraniibacteriota bacterium]|nr:MAG: helix-turn-helix domain-containing protein [Candidatus Moranbacteria bacterium]